MAVSGRMAVERGAVRGVPVSRARGNAVPPKGVVGLPVGDRVVRDQLLAVPVVAGVRGVVAAQPLLLQPRPSAK